VRARQPDSAASAGGSLGRLLAMETRLDALVEGARGHAAALVSGARRAAEVAALELDRELTRLEADRRTAAEAAVERRSAEIARAARLESDRLEGLPAAAVERLTMWLVDRVVARIGAP